MPSYWRNFHCFFFFTTFLPIWQHLLQSVTKFPQHDDISVTLPGVTYTKPRVGEGLVDRHPFVPVDDEQLGDPLLALVWDVLPEGRLKVKLTSSDLGERVLDAVALEWRDAAQAVKKLEISPLLVELFKKSKVGFHANGINWKSMVLGLDAELSNRNTWRVHQSKLMLFYLTHWRPNALDFVSKGKGFRLWKCISKCSLQNLGHFIPTSVC